MTQLVHERLLEEVRDAQGNRYGRALVFAERQPGGTWAAWVEFVSAGGDKVLRTERETTQSSLDGVAYWASGLQRTYFQGAVLRALRRAVPAMGGGRAAPGRLVYFRVLCADHRAPLRVMAAPSLVPGERRQVHESGAIVYVRTLEPALREMPRIYEFLAHFQSEEAASALAARLEADLQGADALLEIRRREVPVDAELIRAALVEAAATAPE